MNSRQTYDEEETLRRVIEESRGEGDAGSVTRKGKRTRDDSEEYARHAILQGSAIVDDTSSTKQDSKRQRTSSDSIETFSAQRTGSVDLESDGDASGSKSTASSLKKQKSAAAETQRQRDLREKEKIRESQRAEAAGRRKERAGRRRVDGETCHLRSRVLLELICAESEAVETPKLEPKETPVPASSQPPSPPAVELPPPSSSHKRGGNRKPKRLGRNQYTKDRDLPIKGVESPRLPRSNTGNNASSGEEPNATNGSSHTSNPKNSPSSAQETATTGKGRGNRWKGKHSKASANDSEGTKEKGDLTIKDMDKGTQFMLDFIGKHQGERIIQGRSLLFQRAERLGSRNLEQGSNKPFDQLSSTEMAEELMKQITTWRGEYTNTLGGLTV